MPKSDLQVSMIPSAKVIASATEHARDLYVYIRAHVRSPLEALAALELARYLVQDSLPAEPRHHTLAQLTELEPVVQELRALLAREFEPSATPSVRLAACPVCRKTLCMCEPGSEN